MATCLYNGDVRSHLIHGSDLHRTQGVRRSILTHYASADCEFNEAIANVLPQRFYERVPGRRPSR